MKSEGIKTIKDGKPLRTAKTVKALTSACIAAFLVFGGFTTASPLTTAWASTEESPLNKQPLYEYTSDIQVTGEQPSSEYALYKPSTNTPQLYRSPIRPINNPRSRPNQVFVDGIRLENVVVINDRTYIQLREFVDKTNLQLILDEQRQLINVFSTEEPPVIARETILFPALVEISADRRVITKTYYLSENQNPAEIDIDDFVEGGMLFALTSMSREENPMISGRYHTQTIQAEIGTNNIVAVLEALGEFYRYNDVFGYHGELRLRHDTIRVEESGFRNEGFTQTETRVYPNLPARDVSLVPRNITVNNRELTLADVQWTTNYTADGSSFTAHATYTRYGVRRITTGYLAIAEFTGEISRFDWGVIKYILTFQAVGQVTNHSFVDLGVIGYFGEGSVTVTYGNDMNTNELSAGYVGSGGSGEAGADSGYTHEGSANAGETNERGADSRDVNEGGGNTSEADVGGADVDSTHASEANRGSMYVDTENSSEISLHTGGHTNGIGEDEESHSEPIANLLSESPYGNHSESSLDGNSENNSESLSEIHADNQEYPSEYPLEHNGTAAVIGRVLLILFLLGCVGIGGFVLYVKFLYKRKEYSEFDDSETDNSESENDYGLHDGEETHEDSEIDGEDTVEIDDV